MTETRLSIVEPPKVENYHQPNVVQDLEGAEDTFRHIRYWQNELDKVEIHATRELEKISRWQDRRSSSIEAKIRWHKYGLLEYMESQHLTKIDLAHGKVKTIKGRERVEVVNTEAFDAWFDEQNNLDIRNLVVTTTIKSQPSLKGLMTHIKATGEIPPGIELGRHDATIKITTDDHLVSALPENNPPTLIPPEEVFYSKKDIGEDIDFD